MEDSAFDLGRLSQQHRVYSEGFSIAHLNLWPLSVRTLRKTLYVRRGGPPSYVQTTRARMARSLATRVKLA